MQLHFFAKVNATLWQKRVAFTLKNKSSEAFLFYMEDAIDFLTLLWYIKQS